MGSGTLPINDDHSCVQLQDGCFAEWGKSAVKVARAQKAEECFILNSDIQWGQQVAVMFQIVSTMALELPSFLEGLGILKGMSPNVQLTFEPWGHDNHEDVDCECQASDRTAAYVHDLTVNRQGPVDLSDSEVASNVRPKPDWRKSLPGLVPFVSCRPGAYGRLLLTVYELWRMGLLVSADWLRPVTRAAGGPVFRTASTVWLMSAD